MILNNAFTHRVCKRVLFSTAFVVIFPLLSRGEVITSDFNRDGKPDAWSYMDGYRIDKQEIDLNFDGKIDTVYIYDVAGKVVEEILDTNYDGKMDNWRYYKESKVVLDKLDTDFDGRPDIWVYVEQGGIYRLERDLNGDGEPDKASVY